VKERKTSELVGSAVGNLIALVLVNSVLWWRQYTAGVILDTWVDVLWAVNLSLIVQIAGNIVLSFYRPARFYSVVQAIHAAAGLVSIIVFYVVFPLDFSHAGVGWVNTLVKAFLIAGMVGTSIGLIVHFVRAASGLRYAERRQTDKT
jgi:hypothetical protein